jgi:hypothetical protein
MKIHHPRGDQGPSIEQIVVRYKLRDGSTATLESTLPSQRSTPTRRGEDTEFGLWRLESTTNHQVIWLARGSCIAVSHVHVADANYQATQNSCQVRRRHRRGVSET